MKRSSMKCLPSRNRAAGQGSSNRMASISGPMKETCTHPRSCTLSVWTPHRTPKPTPSPPISGKKVRLSADQKPKRARVRHSAAAKTGNCRLIRRNSNGTMKGASSGIRGRMSAARRSAMSSAAQCCRPSVPAKRPNCCTVEAACSAEYPNSDRIDGCSTSPWMRSTACNAGPCRRWMEPTECRE